MSTFLTFDEYNERKQMAAEQLANGEITQEEFDTYVSELDARYTAPNAPAEIPEPEPEPEVDDDEVIEEEVIFGIASVGITAVSDGKKGRRRDTKTLMALYWEDPNNQRLIPLGKFMSSVIQGKTLAEWLASGKKVHLSRVQYGKHTLYLGLDGTAGQDFALDARANEWLCPGCQSAHGSGLLSSGSSGDKTPNAYALAGSDNRFFLNLNTREIVVFSKTCFRKYATEALTPARYAAIFSPATAAEIRTLSKQRRAG